MNLRDNLKDKKRIVIKIGSSSLTHTETGRLNLMKMEILVRELADLHNQGKDVIVVRCHCSRKKRHGAFPQTTGTG